MADTATSTSTSHSSIPPSLRPGQHTPTPSNFANGQPSPSRTIPTSAYLPSILPSGTHPLSGISLRAHLLGLTLGLSASLTIHLLSISSTLWRAPFFLAVLSTFHFLEFYITAAYNTPLAKVEAFLLSTNGAAYNVAHGVALVETVASHWWGWYDFPLLRPWTPLVITVGLGMIILGQTVRSVAMAHAGTNFNHTVQSKRNDGHVLVTNGIYSLLRHPSYFGFFWWGLGTQVVLGNLVCFVCYAGILWKFFEMRIRREEEYLTRFFGQDYVIYKKKTGVGIPFIR